VEGRFKELSSAYAPIAHPLGKCQNGKVRFDVVDIVLGVLRIKLWTEEVSLSTWLSRHLNPTITALSRHNFQQEAHSLLGFKI
jgi:hypothetical protein